MAMDSSARPPDAIFPTRVVHIRRDRYDVYIGRNFRGKVESDPSKDGYFGNPFAVRQHGRAALSLFREYMLRRIEEDPEYRRRLLALGGKVLGCFCVRADGSGECHGKIIAEWVDAQRRAA